MDDQALQALCDVSGQHQALQYFDQLKSTPNGWQLCAQALSSGAYASNDHVKFFCLQVIEHFVKSSYATADNQTQQNVKTLLMSLLHMQGNQATRDKSFLRNKVAQLWSLVFVIDFPTRWLSFFSDLLQSLAGPLYVDVFLRILQAIDSEVVDREIVHTPQEQERNTRIKDTMRDHCVQQLVDSWYQILTTYETSNPEVACLCLDVIGNYVSWIDINLIANDRFVGVLLRFLRAPLLRESTCDCIVEIVNKGMEPVAKLKLIESFSQVLESSGVLQIGDGDSDEGDYLVKLAQLLNAFGMNLMQCWSKLIKCADGANASGTLQAIENKISLLFRFLADEDDDVSAAVSDFTHDYINVLKQLNPLTDVQKENVKKMLCILMMKMKYDGESYNFEQEGEEEAMFQEYRKQLKVILSNLAALDAELIISTVSEIVTSTLANWRQQEFNSVELAITLLYMIGEALPASHGQHFSGDKSKTSALQDMMGKMVTSGVSCHSHQAVLLQYFETAVRYEKFFQVEPQHLGEILGAFLDERGLHNRSPQVRSRVTYLLSRFVKAANKNQMQSYVEVMLKQLDDLLTLNTPDNGYHHLLTADEQLFLYETASMLIVHSQFPVEKKEQLMKNLLAPIVTKFEGLFQKMLNEGDKKRQEAYAECLTQAMSFASRTSKGFTNQQTMKQCGCVPVFTQTMDVFIRALATPYHRPAIHAGVRQFLHRMVVCLEAEVLPFVPAAMQQLLKSPDARELHDFIPLMNQLIQKFKKSLVPFLQETFLPLVTTIFQALSSPTDALDQDALCEKQMLQRSYFVFLSTIVHHKVEEVVSNQESQHFQQVLQTVIHGAVELPDPVAQKSCFSILKRLVELWGGTDSMSGFVDFIYKSIVPACFMAPMKSTFDLNDARTILALGETATCLKTIREKRGDEFVNFLQNDYLPGQQVPPQTIQDYMKALRSDIKIYKNFLKVFFQKAKS